jgi:hypothetical protein
MRKQSLFLFLASLLTGFLAPVFPSMSDEIDPVEQGWSPADKTAWALPKCRDACFSLGALRLSRQQEASSPD